MIQTSIAFSRVWPWLVNLNFITGKFTGGNFLRKHFYENQSFAQVKRCFFNFLNNRVFNFGKAGWYLRIPQPV